MSMRGSTLRTAQSLGIKQSDFVVSGAQVDHIQRRLFALCLNAAVVHSLLFKQEVLAQFSFADIELVMTAVNVGEDTFSLTLNVQLKRLAVVFSFEFHSVSDGPPRRLSIRLRFCNSDSRPAVRQRLGVSVANV